MSGNPRSLLLLPLRILWSVWVVSAFVATFAVLSAAGYLIPESPRWALAVRRFSGLWGRVFLAISGIPVVVGGKARLRRIHPVVIVANHSGYLDIPIVMGSLRGDFVFLAKKEMKSWPVFGRIMRNAGHLFVDRSAATRGRIISDMKAAFRMGSSILVFPEGTFNPEDGLQPFALGAFKAAVVGRCPILPVAIRGSRRIFRPGDFMLNPGLVRVKIGKAIPPRGRGKDEVRRLRDRARAFILAHCGEPDGTAVPDAGGDSR